MAQEARSNLSLLRAGALGPILSELVLLLTILISVAGVALLIFLPRAFLGDQASVGVYLDGVSTYLAELARGDLGLTAALGYRLLPASSVLGRLRARQAAPIQS